MNVWTEKPKLNGKNGKETAAARNIRPDKNGNQALIEMRRVTKIYQTAAGGYTALKDIELQIGRGEFVGIIGRSGSGKSTLINMITGIDRPTSGEILVGGAAVHRLSENQMARWRGRNLGIVFQFFQLLPNLSVLENVILPMDFCNAVPLRERRQRALELLEWVGMAEHANKLPAALSGGQQQRVAIARALANHPPIVIADEPTGNLDSKTADAMFRLLEKLTHEGTTVIMVTHDSSLAQRVSRTVLIADNEIVNEYIARALPSLTPEQMLAVSRKARTVSFPPGATMIAAGEAGKQPLILTRGTAEVLLRRPGGSDVITERMGPGQFCGENYLFPHARTSASVRANPEAPVEALALDAVTFDSLLAESEPLRTAMESVAATRLARSGLTSQR